MDDLFYLVITFAAFGVLFALIKGVEKLRSGVGDE